MTNTPIHLKRNIGLWLLLFYGLGNILGAGIYVLVGEVVGAAGMGAPLAFVLAAMVAGLTAFTYGELAARFPVSAGEAVYVNEAFDARWLSTAVGVLIATAGIADEFNEPTRVFTVFAPDNDAIVALAAILIAFWLSMAFSGQMLVSFYQQALVPRIAGQTGF